ncbi:hypothetical protein PFICI_08702 [Pestalotiopsis fici W106-1]|uniref:Uncharacterized protein n=1 Tax=Pestalotiopsis fici (strain W106-1 / CGMCC3.15140) TaxID=1229662 RepID=W3WYJ8_PESFW|nr:uncharacterized protein PFICI_08702 [Pestalotiopsis fici W106-1]ETS78849.1 hypothetical protein PFICI_08702 [Pestalotiopsis fici W106-1]
MIPSGLTASAAVLTPLLVLIAVILRLTRVRLIRGKAIIISPGAQGGEFYHHSFCWTSDMGLFTSTSYNQTPLASPSVSNDLTDEAESQTTHCILVDILINYYMTSKQLNAELRRVSTWYLNLHTTTANGDLYPARSRPVGRQMPNPEADAIWDEWEVTRVFPIHADEVRRLGKDLETAVLLEDKYYGRGDDIYAATLDIYHQLHCLNQLRWIAYGTYYNISMLSPSEEGFREVHINHCVDMLAQTIQYTGNLNLITMYWTETKSFPFPDMSINHKCVDFDALTEWCRRNTIDMDVWSHRTANILLRPQGSVLRPAPDAEYIKTSGDAH